MNTSCSPTSALPDGALPRRFCDGAGPDFVPAFPLHVVFILDNRCNLSCTHCSSNASRTGSRGFEPAEALRVVDELADVGVVDVAFSGGEPLLRPDLPALVRHARDAGLTAGTSTNGSALTAAKAAELAAAGLSRLQVSVDGPRTVHDTIRGPGSFDRAIRAIGRSREAGLRTHVCFTAMRSNVAHLAAVIDLAAAAGAQGFNLSQFVATGRGTLHEDLDAAQAHDALQTWLAARRSHPDMSFAAHAAGLADLDPAVGACSGGCQAGMGIACVTAEGEVTPCVMLPLALGNLRRRSFRDIWVSHPLLDRLRRRDVGGACGSCSHRIACGGCRAAAWARSGNALASDPRCWHH